MNENIHAIDGIDFFALSFPECNNCLVYVISNRNKMAILTFDYN